MFDGPYIAEAAALIGDPARANMLLALKDEGALTASELAHIAGVTPQTASGHLAKLTQAGLAAVERQGRHRYYRLAEARVADALEALMGLAVATAPRRRRPGPRDEAVRFARSCYDHLAGRLGVALTWSLVEQGSLDVRDDGFLLTGEGEKRLSAFGLEPSRLRPGRRPLTRRCLDWSERRPHLGGALGAALMTRALTLGWIARRKGSRAVALTTAGRTGFKDVFGVDLDPV
ncbi:MAG TPA: winged helix-turn-helix domain-containing protein [Kiloniellales bacterium]